MRSKISLIISIFISQFLSAKENCVGRDSVLPHNFFEIGYGTGFVNNRFTPASGFVNAGYGNIILTARFCRSAGTEWRGYIFEDAFLVGYRKNFCRNFSMLFSAGYSDLAFEKGYHTFFDATPDMFNTSSGFSLESELEWKISAKNKISPFSISAIYYSTFNSQMNLNGVVLALKFCPERFGKHWYD